MKKLLFILLLVSMIAALAACIEDPDPNLKRFHGKWEVDEDRFLEIYDVKPNTPMAELFSERTPVAEVEINANKRLLRITQNDDTKMYTVKPYFDRGSFGQFICLKTRKEVASFILRSEDELSLIFFKPNIFSFQAPCEKGKSRESAFVSAGVVELILPLRRISE